MATAVDTPGADVTELERRISRLEAMVVTLADHLFTPIGGPSFGEESDKAYLHDLRDELVKESGLLEVDSDG